MPKQAPPFVVAIPVCNEADHIARCLCALDCQHGACIDHVVLLLNNCTDATEAVIARLRPMLDIPVAVHVRRFAPGQCTAGHARSEAMELAALLAGSHGIVATTDADGRGGARLGRQDQGGRLRPASTRSAGKGRNRPRGCEADPRRAARGQMRARSPTVPCSTRSTPWPTPIRPIRYRGIPSIPAPASQSRWRPGGVQAACCRCRAARIAASCARSAWSMRPSGTRPDVRVTVCQAGSRAAPPAAWRRPSRAG